MVACPGFEPGSDANALSDELYTQGGMGAVPHRDANLLHLYRAYERIEHQRTEG